MSNVKFDVVGFYQQLISNAGMVSSEEGHISTQLASGASKEPTLVKGKRLVLPTPAQLRSASAENSIIFHPLSENLLRGESDVMAVFRAHLNKKLNFALAYFTISLMDLAIASDKHPKLSPDQSLYLSVVKHADENTMKVLKEITAKMMVDDTENSFIHMYIKRGGIMAGKKHSRVCVTSFPLYEELAKEPEPRKPITFLGVKLRKVDRECLLGLLQFVLPNIAEQQAYWGSSNSQIAPTLDAVMRSVATIGSRINDVAVMYSDYIEDVDSITYNLDHLTVLDSLDSIIADIRMIPMQLGNEGSVPSTAKTSAPTITVESVPVTKGPAVETSPFLASKPPIGQVSAGEYVPPAAVTPTPQVTQSPYQPVQQPTYQPPWQPAPAQYPQAPYQQAPYQHPAPVQVPQAGLVRTANGLDVNSIFQSNPALAANAGWSPYAAQHVPGYAMQPQQRQPGWTAPQQTPGYPQWQQGHSSI